jgi:hypothetical protein
MSVLISVLHFLHLYSCIQRRGQEAGSVAADAFIKRSVVPKQCEDCTSPSSSLCRVRGGNRRSSGTRRVASHEGQLVRDQLGRPSRRRAETTLKASTRIEWLTTNDDKRQQHKKDTVSPTHATNQGNAKREIEREGRKKKKSCRRRRVEASCGNRTSTALGGWERGEGC